MRAAQHHWTIDAGWCPTLPERGAGDLVLLFGATERLLDGRRAEEVARAWPEATLLGGSTAGEIHGDHVSDDSVVATVLRFEHTQVRGKEKALGRSEDSEAVGRALAADLTGPDLAHVLVVAEGIHVNGSSLVRGLSAGLPEGVRVSGGLAGDGERFGQTLVATRVGVMPERVAAVGLYGTRLKIGCGSLGGWDPFGPERLITRSKDNVLYELDGRSALSLYKRYLGAAAADLPASGLRFPLSLRDPEGRAGLVRTILSVDESAQTLTFAGDVPEGSYARLMRANFDRLIDGAQGAAEASRVALGAEPSEVALLISCVGRKMVLQQRVEEEIEGVREIFGPGCMLAGFYSYGEIAPFAPGADCQLHNQTMTITTLAER